MIGLYCIGRNITLKTDLAEPLALPDEVLLKVTHAGICDTDIQLAKGYMGFEGILGHEFVALDAHHRRYTAEINNACHSCDYCLRGLKNHCPNRSVLGIFRHNGAMAEQVAVPVANLHAIPDSIPDLSAVFIEPLAAAFQILEQIPIEPEMNVAVLGDGKLGTLCAWVLATKSNHVTLIGKHQLKLDKAGKTAQTKLLNDALESDRKSYDIVVEATGNASGLASAIEICRPRGTIVLKTTIEGPHQLSLAGIVIDELTVVGSRCGPFPKAIDALSLSLFPVECLIEQVYPLAEGEAAFAHAGRKGAGKIVLVT
ncbi:MAG: alcohol dehydrogenase catalytic domain-containing protein [bacterium]